MRNYNSTRHLKSISAAVIAVAGLCFIPVLANAQVAGPTNPGASILTGPGVAGVANPTSFSVFDRPGVAGNVPTRTGSSTLGPGVAGVREPASFSPLTRPAFVGAGPLGPGLTATAFPSVSNVSPVIVDGVGIGPGIAGPTNPAAFGSTTGAGVATGPSGNLVTTGMASGSRGDFLAAPSMRTTLSNVDLSGRTALIGRTTTTGATAGFVISNRGGAVTTSSRQ